MADDPNALSADSISVRYGTKVAANRISVNVSSGEALAVAGANGAGKSSFLAGLVGSVEVYEGTLSLGGRTLPHDLHRRQRAGIRLVPEQGKIFPTMTVEENLRVSDRTRGSVTIDDAYQWFPRLKRRRKTLGGNLSGGEQQMLAIGMAILGDPKALLLDEPTLGLSVPVIHDLAEKLNELRKSLSLAVVVAESDAEWLPLLTERAIVIDRGRQVAEVERYSKAALRTMESYMVGLESL